MYNAGWLTTLLTLNTILTFLIPKILDKEQNLEKRLILEMIEILNNKNSINKRSDMDCFSNVYKKIYGKIILRKYLYFLLN